MTTKNVVAKQSILITVPPARVWEALTDPKLIKHYLFGTDVETDWKVGSTITYRGVWESKPYEDKGTIMKIIPQRLLVSTYWSGLSGLSDVPENYKNVTYELTPADGGTQLTVTQDGNETEESKTHSEQNWKIVLEGMKKLLEA